MQGLKESWTDFIKAFHPYDWFVTLTFRDDVTENKAHKLLNKYIRTLNVYSFGKRYREHGNGLIYVVSREYQKRGVIHFHLLLKGIPLQASRKHWADYWNSTAFDASGSTGFAVIRQYDINRGASGYIAKYCQKGGLLDIFSPPSFTEQSMDFQDSRLGENARLNLLIDTMATPNT